VNKLYLVLILILQIVYYFATSLALPKNLFILIWFPVWACNYYLLYNLFPLWKNYMKSKSKSVRVFYYIGLFILSGVLTNGPTEIIG
tara:strand:+ start:267 stop:527 length:261 start_codon:yes stop_codon:yes gene_type:complete